MAENEKAPSPAAGSRRLEILQQSLEKKEKRFDEKLQAHFDDVKSANGQPLNDKRNGQATLNRWEKQNGALRRAQAEIEKTQRAIEREQAKINKVAGTKIPDFLKAMLESGEISQWRKYPNRFFVKGVDKARIIWFEDKQAFGYGHIGGLPPEQFALFRDTYNRINAMHEAEQERIKQAPAAADTDSGMEKSAPNKTYALFGRAAGQEHETFIADKVRLDDGNIVPIDKEHVAEWVKRDAEKQGFTDVRILAVTEGERPDFAQAATASAQAGDKTAPEKHYSEKIIGRLAEHHGWTKEHETAASKTYGSAQEGGSLNPEGRLNVHARFDESGRYLSLERGWDTLFDIDTRNVRPEAAAALVDDYAEKLRHTDKPFDRSEIDMRLYGMNLYHSARQSPENAAEAREVLPAPHLLTPERFAESARAVPAGGAGARWQVRWPEATEHGMGYAFSNEAGAAEAVRDAHRTVVKAHLHRTTGGGTHAPEKAESLPQEVLAHYPDLQKQYLPSAQSPDDKLQAAKDAYAKQLRTLSPAKQERSRLLESQMENLIKGLPEQTRTLARTNFYQSRVNAHEQKQAVPARQDELSFDR